jgi:hypothetical protein
MVKEGRGRHGDGGEKREEVGMVVDEGRGGQKDGGGRRWARGVGGKRWERGWN